MKGTNDMSAALVKELRASTGAGVMDCKRALEETDGNVEQAALLLRQQGLDKADKKLGRQASQGLIECYVHAGGRIGSMVEVNCETDFVARTDDFKALAHDLALQAAAMPPRFITVEELSDEDRRIGVEESGSEKRFLETAVFMEQPFIKDSSSSIAEVVRDVIAKVGENIVVRRVERFEVGETTRDEDNDSE